jgi:ribose transport system substrate-binding protein
VDFTSLRHSDDPRCSFFERKVRFDQCTKALHTFGMRPSVMQPPPETAPYTAWQAGCTIGEQRMPMSFASPGFHQASKETARLPHPFRRTRVVLFGIAVASASLTLAVSCRRGSPTVAVIPRTCGTALWEPEHAGAASVARPLGVNLYWNAPTRDSDVQRQIWLLEEAQRRGYEGIIIAPDETLALRSPVRWVLAKHVPTVVVGTRLGIPAGDLLSYVLNDEVAGGQIAARRVAQALHGTGSVAIVGINPKLWSVITRERSFEAALTQEFPQIHIVSRRLGQVSALPEQEIAEELLHSAEKIDAIVALSSTSTRGCYYALLESKNATKVALVGFDQDLLPPIRTGDIDSVIVQDGWRASWKKGGR